jgi:Response regulator containing a CheY-like receiver domain and an HD-GYP domain
MDEPKIITILLVENEKSGEKLEELLKEFSSKNKINILIFSTENKLLEFLKRDKDNEGCKNHYITLFNVNPPLNNLMTVITEIKEDPDLTCIPMFLITLSIENEDIINSYNSYLNCYIIKPKDMEGLIKVLNSFKTFWFDIATLP